MPITRIWDEDNSKWQLVGGSPNTSPELFLGQTLYFTADDSPYTFSKADYPGLAAVRAKVQGGGGAGGGAPATGDNQLSIGGGGSGGSYGEEIILVSALSVSETVTVGAGGTGVSGDGGNNGETSSFGAHLIAPGGRGGFEIGPVGLLQIAKPGGQSTVSASGDFNRGGGMGGPGIGTDWNSVNGAIGGQGGDSMLGSGGHPSNNDAGGDGGQYGGGGAGSARRESETALAGGDGADGIVIVELYYLGVGEVSIGYRTGPTLYFEAAGSPHTFSKADYPGLRAVRVKCQGAGGGAGNPADTGAGEGSYGTGGGGGGYTEKLILASALSASETVTVGEGGVAGVSHGSDGSSGENSSFGSHCTANGGGGGDNVASSGDTSTAGGAGGSSSGGDINLSGSPGLRTPIVGGTPAAAAQGGSSALGESGSAGLNNAADASTGFGAGGSGVGRRQANSNDYTVRPGTDGIVIVELLY